MSVESKLEMGKGGIVFWSLSEYSDGAKLKAGFESLGFERFAPEERPPMNLLKGALEEVYGNARTLIRPLATRNGFAIIKEERGFEENKYENRLTAIVDESGELQFSNSDENTLRVQEEFVKQKGLVASNQLATALVAVARAMTGVSLRPQGAIYWLAGSQLDTWRKVAQVVEGSGDHSSVYLIEHQIGDESVKAVRDAITNDIAVASDKLLEDITSGKLGHKALFSKKAIAESLKARVALYESLLGESLGSLRGTLETVENSANIAVLAINAAIAKGIK